VAGFMLVDSVASPSPGRRRSRLR